MKREPHILSDIIRNTIPDLNVYFNGDGHLDSYILAHHILDAIQIKTLSDSEDILVYINGIYEENNLTPLKKEIQKRIGNSASLHTVNEVIGHIQRSTFTDREEFNKDINMVPLKNGILNIKTKEMTEFSPDKLYSFRIPVSYVPGTDCPAFKKFLSEIMSEGDAIITQEFFGYCLLRDYPIHKAIVLIGEGSNGKSVLLNVLKKFIGTDNVCSLAIQDFDYNRFSLQALYGKLANIYADLTDKSMRQTGRFKMITGGDELNAEKKFGDYISFVNYAKQIYSANKLPETEDDTYAFYRRWIIINFPNKFEGDKADKNLLSKITTDEELSGILNWAIEGYERLITNGDFSVSETTDQTKDRYIKHSDSLKAFVIECIESDPEGVITRDAFFRRYADYCKKNNLQLKTKTSVGQHLPDILSYVTSRQVNKERAWGGIKFKQEDITEELIKQELLMDTPTTLTTDYSI